VTANRKRWTASIHYDGKEHNLGTFDTKQEAALVYDRKARRCGKDKPLNYESVKAAKDAAVQAQAEHALTYPKQPKPRPKPRPPSGFYGVYANGKRWQAVITYGSKRHKKNLGTFDSKQEAALAYDREARQRGEEKLLNYESVKAAEEAAAHAQAEHTLTHPKQPKPRPTSGFYGVCAAKKRWQAVITYGSKNQNLGTFDSKQEAALAYDREARQRGEEKLLNYESIKAAEEAAAAAQAEHTLAHPKQPKPRPTSGFRGVSANEKRWHPTSGFYGVHASGKRWQAKICYSGKDHYLGTFNTKQEAALAYDREARQCGEEKPLNYESVKAAEEAAVKAQAEHRYN
jgi:hypothetical protein